MGLVADTLGKPALDLVEIAECAHALMQGDPVVHKQGYTFANALLAMSSAAKLYQKPLTETQFAIVAEKLHEMVVRDGA